MLLSPSFGRSPSLFTPSSTFTPTRQAEAMNLDEPSSPFHLNGHASANAPSVGTPIRLVPSASAFRQSTGGGLSTAAAKRDMQGHQGVGQMPNANGMPLDQQHPSLSKGLVGQAVDLIFGW